MTTTSERPRATQRTAKPEGQWAKGEFDPLNPNEVFKAEDAPLNVRARILEQYAREGFDSISGTDLRGRMRCSGGSCLIPMERRCRGWVAGSRQPGSGRPMGACPHVG